MEIDLSSTYGKVYYHLGHDVNQINITTEKNDLELLISIIHLEVIMDLRRFIYLVSINRMDTKCWV